LTFRDLQKRVSLQARITQQQQSKLTDKLQKRFWIWNIDEHKEEDIKIDGDCCFNHIIGLPTKEGEEKVIFDYEKILYDALLDNDNSNVLHHTFKHKHL
jgi:hypothetical protein